MNDSTSILFIVSAPSGAGKTSLLRELLQRDKQLSLSVSHTTRAMRPGEQDGVDYHFADKQAFMQLVGEGAFIEHAQVFQYDVPIVWEPEIRKRTGCGGTGLFILVVHTAASELVG